MDLTRRQFLSYSAGAIGLLAPPVPSPRIEPRDRRPETWHVLQTDLANRNSESMRGYLSAIPPERSSILPERLPPWPCSLIIVPYVRTLFPDVTEHLTEAMNGGTTVVIETCAGFDDPWTFQQHRRWLRERLQIGVGSPVNLWEKRSGTRGDPYIEFTWPQRALIRDFSRVVPPAQQTGEIIARAGDLPVAFRRRVGKGKLIYLGSPVGLALWAGDVEARRWLSAVALAA